MVVLVENVPRVGDVDRVVGSLGPRQGENPFDVAANDAGFGRQGRESPKAARFAAGAVLHELRHRAFLDLRFELGGVGPIILAELSVNGLELFLEIELALILNERSSNLVVELSLEPEHLDFGADHVVKLAEEIRESLRLEQALSDVVPDRDVRGDAVGLALRRFRRLNHVHDLARDPAMQGDVLLELGDGAARDRADVGRIGRSVAAIREDGAHDAAGMGVSRDARASDALDENARRSVRLLHEPVRWHP